MTSEIRERQPDEIFCPSCGVLIKRTFSFCPNCGSSVPDVAGIPEAPTAAPSPYPVRFSVEYPPKLSRGLIFVKWLLIIPQLLIVYALGMVTAMITVVAWFAILFTRRYPRGLFNMVVGFNRWSVNVYSYIALLRDEYPPFSMDPGRYPVHYEVEYPERLSRWLIFVKWILAFPQQIVLNIVAIAAFLVYVFSWFAILFTGRYPRGAFDFMTGFMRWWLRIGAYTALLRDEFPPFSMSAQAGPGSRRSIIICAILGVILYVAFIGGCVALVVAEPETTEVRVNYDRLLDGDGPPPLRIEGTRVALIDAEDPYPLGSVGSRRRAVAFEFRIANEDALFSQVSTLAFRLRDSDGRVRDAQQIFLLSVLGDTRLAEGESAHILVVFELDRAAAPRELTYSPGFAAFLPIGERVRFIFD